MIPRPTSSLRVHTSGIMSKEIIINTEKNQTRIALVENAELIELYIEDSENERTLGDIYLGRIRRTMPSIQAAFVDIGQKQDAFLHYSDLADNLPQWLKLLEQSPPRVSEIADSLIEEAPAPKKHRASQRPKRKQSVLEKKQKRGNADELIEEIPTESDHVDMEPDDAVLEPADTPNGASKQKNKRSSRNSRAPGKVRRRPPRKDYKKEPTDLPPSQSQDQEEENPRDNPSGEKENGEPKRVNGKRSKDHKPSRQEKPQQPELRPEKFLDKGKQILVKIVKEPISAKGSRVSTDISLAGRFLVLVPLANYVAVSKKIYSYKERRRLRALARSLLPAGFGVIVRTVAQGKKAKELDTDLRLLLEKWRKIEKRLETASKPPVLVHEDVNMASSVIRDLFSDDYDRILVDDPKLYRNVKNYVQAVAPHMVPAVQHFKGKRHIFKAVNIAHEINQAFESRVDLPSGGYLFIEHTEAMHVVDVNSGRAGRGLSQEENSLKVDIEAVHSIAKQIRLRDLGGIIVIDFIDLKQERNRKKVYYELRKAFRKDRAVTKILPMSDFGLVEITRQRLRPSITKTFSGPEEKVPTPPPVENAQVAEPPKEPVVKTTTIDGFIAKLDRWIAGYKSKSKSRIVTLRVHPFAAAFLNQKIPAYPIRWFMKYLIRVRISVDENLNPLEFRFVDPSTGKNLSPSSTSAKRSKKR